MIEVNARFEGAKVITYYASMQEFLEVREHQSFVPL